MSTSRQRAWSAYWDWRRRHYQATLSALHPGRQPWLGESLLPAVKHGGAWLVRVVAGGGVETARGHVASRRIASRARAQSSAWIPGVVSLVHSNGLSISLTAPVAGGRVERNADHGNVKACVRLQPTAGVGKMTESRDPGKRPLLQHQPSDGCGEIQERRTSKSRPTPAGAAPEVARAPTEPAEAITIRNMAQGKWGKIASWCCLYRGPSILWSKSLSYTQ